MIIHELREQYTIYPTHKNRNTIIPGPKPPTAPHTPWSISKCHGAQELTLSIDSEST